MNALPCRTAACLVGGLLSALLVAGPADGAENVTFRRDGQSHTVRGELLVEARDGGLLLLARDGVVWDVQPEEIVERSQDSDPAEPYDRQELFESLSQELPEGFRRHDTAHYLIIYNTTPAYAEWCGALYERLYWGFTNYWEHRGLELSDPPAPLVALIFRDQASYANYARGELGQAAESIVGYYSLRTNRMAMYDLTGVEGLRRGSGQGSSAAQVNRILAQPRAAATVSTIVHEATHQVAYNCGLQTRFADNPLWVSEGLAMFFETPDLKSSRGWQGIGRLNVPRLNQFRDYLGRRPADSLRTLLADDQRFLDADGLADAYAESWLLTHFLARRYTDEYAEYLDTLGDKGVLLYDTPQERLELFESTFGVTIEELDRQLVDYARRLD